MLNNSCPGLKSKNTFRNIHLQYYVLVLVLSLASCSISVNERKSLMYGNDWSFEKITLTDAIEVIAKKNAWGRKYSYKVQNDRVIEKIDFAGVISNAALLREIKSEIPSEIYRSGNKILIILSGCTINKNYESINDAKKLGKYSEGDEIIRGGDIYD